MVTVLNAVGPWAVGAMAVAGMLTAGPVSAAPATPLDPPPCNILWGDYCNLPPAQAPKEGPTVTTNPGLAGVTFHVTDRSGVASQCTYSSEGYTDSFGLPAKSSFDLFVPAVRLMKTRTGTITCDNGTSTNTSVFF